MISSIGGGLVGAIYAFAKPGPYVEVMDFVNPILGSLVGVTAGCAVYHTYDGRERSYFFRKLFKLLIDIPTLTAFVVGIVGALVILLVSRIPDTLGVDDPVGGNLKF